MSYRKLGDMVKFVSNKNTDGNVTVLFGINIDKFFMPSVANIIGVDLKKYKVVAKYQFACNRMHVGRDERLPISMSTFDYNFIVSPAYDVFEITSSDVLPEYLMLWFRRKEFDRQCWFFTDADVRGGLHLDALKSIEIKVPSIEEQRQIVAQYQSIANKIKVNEQICEKLESTAQALYKHWFVDFEFPNENGQPYKSSGGTMIWNEELGKEIPEGWEVAKLEDYVKINRGASPRPIENFITNNEDDMPWVKISDATAQKTDFLLDTKQFIDKYGVKKSRVVEIGDLILSNSASPGLPKIMNIKACVHDGWLIFNDYKKIDKYFLIEYLKFNKQGILSEGNGSVFKNLKTEILKDYQIILNENCVNSFSFSICNIYELIQSNSIKIKKLTQLQILLLSRLAVGEEVSA